MSNDEELLSSKSPSCISSDEEFLNVCRHRLFEHPLSKEYPDLFEKAALAFLSWRKRYASRNPKLWNRLFSMDRVTKEFVEASPVLSAVIDRIEEEPEENNKKTYTIIDLCSGKGYLGMLLSEILPPSKVFRIVLMDKAWPMRNSEWKDHHINWEHIYGTYGSSSSSTTEANRTTTEEDVFSKVGDENSSQKPIVDGRKSYYDTWPIPIDTSKQDLKSSRQLEQIRKHYLSNPDHPVIVLGIHLCGILSLRAIDLFHANPLVTFLALKPCCLPGMIHAKQREIFSIGNHCFPATDVCVAGKWNKNRWQKGPPRSHLEPKFTKWASHLHRGLESPDLKTGHAVFKVQQKGFQNDFLFVERLPVVSHSMWEKIERNTSNVVTA